MNSDEFEDSNEYDGENDFNMYRGGNSKSNKDSYIISSLARPTVYPGTSDMIEKMYKMLTDNPKKALPLIINLIKKYPEEPMLHNHLYVAYTLTGDKINAERILFKTIEKFPNYLFGKISYARYLIANDRLDEVASVFNNETMLSRAFPGRKEFHELEAVAFFRLMGFYYSEKNEPEIAIQFFECSTYQNVSKAILKKTILYTSFLKIYKP